MDYVDSAGLARFWTKTKALVTKANLKSTLGIADWALASAKPSYAFSEITGSISNTQMNAGITALPVWTADPTDNTYIIRQDTGGTDQYGRVKASALFNYVKGKLPAWATASSKPSYAFSEISGTVTNAQLAGSIANAKLANSAMTIAGTSVSLGGSITAATIGAALTKIGTATKGGTTLPIYLNAGVPTAVSSIAEAYLSWGGKNLSGSYAPIDAAMVPALGANRAAFIKPAGVAIEYSRDGGTTWTDYQASDAVKTGLFSGINQSILIGKADSSNKATADYKLRITVSTSAAQIYSSLNKFIIYISTNGCTGCTCTIMARLQSNYESSTETWVTFADKTPISGWSGFNVINTSALTTYGNTKTTQYGQIRFLFECTGGSTQYNGLTVQRIFCFGGVGWTTPSTMASSGNLFSYDASQNATFPAKVTATSFSGPLTGNVTGNASTATKLATARTLWGVSFNGTANLTTAPNLYIGTTKIQTSSTQQDLTGIGSLDASGNVIGRSGIAAGGIASTSGSGSSGTSDFTISGSTNTTQFTVTLTSSTGATSTATLTAASPTKAGLLTTEMFNGITQIATILTSTTNRVSAVEDGKQNLISSSNKLSFTLLSGLPTTLQGYGITDATPIFRLTDGGTATAGTWLASHSGITAYSDGMLVLYRIAKAGASTTTLNINSLGAKTVYRYGSTKLTTQYPVGSYLLLYYSTSLNSGSWTVLHDYDANSYAYVRQYVATDNAEYPLLMMYDTSRASAGSYVTKYSRYADAVTVNPSTGRLSAASLLLSGSMAAAGGSLSSHLYLTGSNASSSTANTSQIVFGTASSQHVALSANTKALVINPSTDSTTYQIVLKAQAAASTMYALQLTQNLTVGGSVTVTGSLAVNGSNLTIGSRTVMSTGSLSQAPTNTTSGIPGVLYYCSSVPNLLFICLGQQGANWKWAAITITTN